MQAVFATRSEMKTQKKTCSKPFCLCIRNTPAACPLPFQDSSVQANKRCRPADLHLFASQYGNPDRCLFSRNAFSRHGMSLSRNANASAGSVMPLGWNSSALISSTVKVYSPAFKSKILRIKSSQAVSESSFLRITGRCSMASHRSDGSGPHRHSHHKRYFSPG